MSLALGIATTSCVALTLTALLDPGSVRRLREHPVGARREPAPMRAGWWRGVPPRRRRSTIGPAAIGAWADDLARSLRHGSTLRAALVAVVPDDEALRDHTDALRQRLDRGATVADATDAWGRLLDVTASGSRPLVAFAAVVGVAARLGGSASRPLERFAVTMREHVADDLERSAQSAQAKMSARVLTTVPVAMLAILVVTDADVRGVLGRPSGGGVVAVGLGLNLMGAWWMRRIHGAIGTRSR